MIMPADKKDIPVFKSESVRAMGPAAQAIARIMQADGWIMITDTPEATR